MPAITTHRIFAQDVHKNLNSYLKRKLTKSYDFYLMFAQSFDFFLYHPRKKRRNMQRVAHMTNTQSYFINLVRNVKEKNLVKNPEALAYLFGSINHYVLDSTCHPFIHYKSGAYSKGDKATLKYRSRHSRMEFMLDAYFYESKTGNNFSTYKFIKDFFPKLKPSNELKELMNLTYKKTYNKDNMQKYFFQAFSFGRKLYRLAIYDPWGIKKRFYKIWDAIFWKSNLRFQDCSFYIKNFDNSLLNTENKEWHHPCDKQIKFNYSFLDLYDIAIKKSTFIIEEIYKVLKDEQDIKTLTQIIPNISYHTGLLITKGSKKNLRYFEF